MTVDTSILQSAAIKHLLLLRLQSAIDVSSQTLGIPVMREDEIQFQAIPLRLVKGGMQLLYVSAIALKLANSWQKPVMEVATQIAENLFPSNAASQTSADTALQDFTIKVVPPGWINLHLSDVGTAAWLQRLAQAPPWVESWGAGEQVSRGAGGQVSRGAGFAVSVRLSAQPNGEQGSRGAEQAIDTSPLTMIDAPCPVPNRQSPSIFSAQYAHARCCSLLRLAHREGIITLDEPDPEISPIFFEAIAPAPIPWLDADQKLRLVHPTERNLIFHLLALLDDLYCPSSSHPIDWEKSANALSQAFLIFYSQCRIWGEVKIEAPKLAQARLGLIMATQSLLRLVLQDLLGVPAPLEL